ncbi:MAG: dTDP-4-dehydrorhamnose 3,5-epimerase [Burkholderiaceae bacterium]|nr:dTDP-4-dehydrorhamnose 3,5-epimerase [Burkholderiaceae bacterium]
MLFSELDDVAGVFLLQMEPRHDERGHFARLLCEQELERQGLQGRFVQVNSGFSPRAGTLRGLHFQQPPHAEVKIARCTRGAVFDVAVDLRPDSPTFCRWVGVELRPEVPTLLYVPEGCAHGYLTLADDTELVYFTSRPYAPEAARGVRYDDPAFGIRWPVPVRVISQADRSWPDFTSPPFFARSS